MRTWQAGPLSRSARIYITGHRGLVGSAIKRHLESEGFSDVKGHDSAQVDLRDPLVTLQAFSDARPEVVIHAAAKVGGIAANAAAPVEFLEENLQMQLNVLGAARSLGVQRLLFLGSSCVYPRLAPQPIPESALLTGALEPTNDAYAIAKIAGIMHVRSVRRQYGLPWISAMPTNIYGPGDNFDLETAHALPALLRRAHEAAVASAPALTVWGSGTPRREFLHADDLARACLFLLEHFNGDEAINVGTGNDIDIASLARLVCDVVGFEGELEFDRSRPDGTPRKVLDVSLLNGLGWRPRTGLTEGVRSTYDWFVRQEAVASRRREPAPASGRG